MVTPKFRRGLPEVVAPRHPKDLDYRRVRYWRVPRKNLDRAWREMVAGYAPSKRIVGPYLATKMGGVSKQTMGRYRWVFHHLGLLHYEPGYYDRYQQYDYEHAVVYLLTLDPDAFMDAVPEGLEVWVTGQDTGEPPADQASPVPPPQFVWRHGWNTPRDAPRWLTNGSPTIHPKEVSGGLGTTEGEPLVPGYVPIDAPAPLVLVKTSSRRTLSTDERSEEEATLGQRLGHGTFGIPDVQEALREAGMGHSYAAAKRWIKKTPGVERLEHGSYLWTTEVP